MKVLSKQIQLSKYKLLFVLLNMTKDKTKENYKLKLKIPLKKKVLNFKVL